MDGDGTPELTAFYRPSDAERGVFYQNGPAGVVRKEGTYALRLHGATLEWEAVSAVQSSIAGWSAGVISGDFNGDGLVDFWSGHDASSHLLLNTGAGFLRQTFDHPRPALTQYYPTAKFRRAGALDYDGDGKLDLIEEWTQKNGTPPNADVLLQPFKSPFPSARLLADIMVPVVSGGSRPSPIDMVRDVDGDGSADVIGGSSIFYGKGVRNGLLSKVSDGLGNEVRVDYNDAYRATCSEPQQWPEKCLKRMQGLVSGYTTGFTYESDGIGYFKDEHHYTYTYENARLSMTGHGWLGFDRVVVKENTSGAGAQVTTSTSEFTPLARYTPSGAKATGTAPPYLYPLAGLAKVVTVDQSGSDQGVPTLEDAAHSRRTRKTNHWSVAVSASGRPYPTLDFAETLTFSRPFSGSDGAPVGPDDDGRTRTRCYEMNGNFDGYGNARGTSRGCTQLDGNGDAPQDLEVTRTNVDSFLQDTSAWLISHPSNSHIESYRYPAAPGTIEAQDYSYSYDSLGQLASVIRDPLGDNEQTIYAHDDHGNVMSITHRAPGELDRVTSIIYDDAKLFPVLVTNPEGHATQVSFAADFGQMLGLVDPNGVSVQHSYDGFGRRTLSIDPTGSTLYTFAAQPDTQVKIASDYYVYPRAMVTVEQQDTAHRFAGHSEQLLDNHGRVVRATTFGFQGREVKSDRAFDPRGRVVATIAPRTASDPAAITTYEYDYLDRVWRTTLPDGAVSEHRYGSTVHLGGAYQRLLNGFTCAGTFYSEGPGPTEECAVDVELMSEPHKAGEVVRESALVRDFDGLIVRAYSAAFDQPFRAHPIRIPGIRSGFGAKRRVRGWSGGGLGLGLGFQTFLAAHG